MNKMLDKEDFTMMKRAIFATQVQFGSLNRGRAVPTAPEAACHVNSDPKDCWEFCFIGHCQGINSEVHKRVI